MPQDVPSPTEKARMDHIRAHRSGRPGKIAADPELRAFVEDRIPRMTLVKIEADVAAHFPPARRTSLSAFHRWWQRMRKDRT